MNSPNKRKRVTARKTIRQDSSQRQLETPTVSQSAVIEERICYQKALRAFERWRKRHDAIRSQLEAGAKVETGIYRADIVVEESQSAIFGNRITTTKLTIS